MKLKYLPLFFFCFLPVTLYGQSLSLTVTSQTAGHSPDLFMLDGYKVSLQSNTVEFLNSGNTMRAFLSYGISPDHSLVAFLERGTDRTKIKVLATGGKQLYSFDAINAAAGDPSLAVYPFNDGSVLIRDNIAGYTLFDSFGRRLAGLSGGSDSKQGEVISELAMDPNGKTIVVYTSKIKQQGGGIGSQAQLFTADNQLRNIFSSGDRNIKTVSVSASGQFLALLSAREGTRDEVLIMDRFGNRLNTISTDEDLKDARIASDPEYILVYSSGRAMVFNTLSGERIGSSSFGSGMLAADYFSQDQIVLGMTGEYSSNTGIVRDVEFFAIHLGKRAISSRQLGGVLGMNLTVKPVLERKGPGRYLLKGTSKIVEIRTAF